MLEIVLSGILPGLIGALVAGIVSLIGFKFRINNLEKRVETFQLKDVCAEKHKALDDRLDMIIATQREIREELKKLIEIHLDPNGEVVK